MNNLGNCGHYDDCRTCKCYGCKSTAQCRSCIDCTGSISMSDDPFANYKESCDEFEPARKAKIVEVPKNQDKPINVETNYFKDDMCRRHARSSGKLSEAGRNDIIEKIKIRNSKYTDKDFNTYQTARQDEIENAIYEMIKVVTCDDLLPWNMEVIGDVADVVCEVLSKKGHLIYYPNVTEDENGNFSISDFYGF